MAQSQSENQKTEKKEETRQNRNQGRRPHDRRRNQGHQRPDNRSNRVHARGEQMPLVFQPRYQGDGLVSVLDDGTMVTPGSLRFTPVPGVTYMCSVTFKETRNGRRGHALPSLVETLGPNEWLTDDEYRKALIVNLTFEKRRDGKCISFHQGWVVFPEDRVKADPGVELRCQLREGGGSVLFARPLCVVVQKKDDEGRPTPKATLADTGLSKLVRPNPQIVQMKRARVRSGVQMAKSQKDVVVTTEPRNIWDLLSVPGRPATSDMDTVQLRRAISARIADTEPERKLRKFGDNIPFVLMMEAGHLHEAVIQAARQALELRGLTLETPKPATQAEANPAPATVPRPKAPRPNPPSPPPTAETQPAKEDTRTDALEDALEAWHADERPESGEDLEFYLFRGIALMGQAATAAESEALDKRRRGDNKGAAREEAKARDLKRFKAEAEAELAKLQK